MVIQEPLKLLKIEEMFDIKVTVAGGGIIGQAGAIRHGLTRALILYDNEFNVEDKEKDYQEKDEKTSELKHQIVTWKQKLRKAGFVTR